MSDAGVEGYRKAIEPREFIFPQDHGPHPAYRNEWWYFTGNLDSGEGHRYGFELTIFRFSLTPQPDTELRSAWQTNQVYIGHFAVTDVRNDRFYVAQRYSRGSVGLAGAVDEPFRVWLEDWSISKVAATAGFAAGSNAGTHWKLTASDNEFALDLDLIAEKPVILNGEGGLSQKSYEIGNASYYYSIPRLQSEGRVRIGDETFAVKGKSWLDREWSSSALSGDQQGWDWFALQLSNNTELMFYTLRRNDGSRDPRSAGTFIDAAGVTSYLTSEDVKIEVNDTWRSDFGGTYPSEWSIEIRKHDLRLHVKPVIANQELMTIVRYWEGAVDVAGESAGRPLDGRGYVELTGYAGN